MIAHKITILLLFLSAMLCVGAEAVHFDFSVPLSAKEGSFSSGKAKIYKGLLSIDESAGGK
ncbi:MAG: hypothetical protein PHS41_03105 [Victivallaceae bacterium]|nr:hypothetical protein [Victivallaceae bacterium]